MWEERKKSGKKYCGWNPTSAEKEEEEEGWKVEVKVKMSREEVKDRRKRRGGKHGQEGKACL